MAFIHISNDFIKEEPRLVEVALGWVEMEFEPPEPILVTRSSTIYHVNLSAYDVPDNEIVVMEMEGLGKVRSADILAIRLRRHNHAIIE